MPTAMSNSQGILAEMEASHAMVAKEDEAVQKETLVQKSSRLCFQAPFCLCQDTMSRRISLRARFDEALVALGVKDSPWRPCLEASTIIICFESESGKTAYWYHIAVMYWEPIRPTLVRLMTVDKIHAVDRVRLTHAHRRFSTHDELESDDDADEQAGQANSMWHLI
jgi:hypothetical protein